MAVTRSRAKARAKRRLRIRKKLRGTADRPRLCVCKSNRYMYAQLIDDDRGATVTSISSSRYKESQGAANYNQVAVCSRLGKDLGEALVARGIKEVVFDRSGYPYHGRIKAFADAVRQEGIRF